MQSTAKCFQGHKHSRVKKQNHAATQRNLQLPRDVNRVPRPAPVTINLGSDDTA